VPHHRNAGLFTATREMVQFEQDRNRTHDWLFYCDGAWECDKCGGRGIWRNVVRHRDWCEMASDLKPSDPGASPTENASDPPTDAPSVPEVSLTQTAPGGAAGTSNAT
jgi:hypothetical protein